MKLPDKKSRKIVDLASQTILLYGRAKIGKSTLASQFERPLFLATEAGLNFLEVYKVNITSWEDFLHACAQVASREHEFKTIVIDTIDRLVTYCAEFICELNKVSHPSELPHGKGWHLITVELSRTLHKLANLPYGLILISHCDLVEIDEPTRKHTRWSISVGGKNRKVVLNLADLILFIDSKMKEDKEVRIIRTKPSRNWEAGDRSNLLPEELLLDYQELAKYFTNEKAH